MPKFKRGDVTICFEQDGARTDLPVVLVHGIGCQLNQWPRSLVKGLVSHGLRVIRMDSRDAGLSSSMDHLGTPDFAALMAGKPVEPPYTMRDMAGDVIALLDHLGQAGAHLVGVSLGGMVVQNAAIAFPERVYSMTSIMSSSGHPDLPAGDEAARKAMTSQPESSEPEAMIEHMRTVWDVLGGPHYRSRDVGIGAMAADTFRRAQNPAGFARQYAAASADTQRWQRLASITSPTLVVHGDADLLVPEAAGADTAERIPGARLEIISNMGHDLPEPLMPALADLLANHINAAPAKR